MASRGALLQNSSVHRAGGVHRIGYLERWLLLVALMAACGPGATLGDDAGAPDASTSGDDASASDAGVHDDAGAFDASVGEDAAVDRALRLPPLSPTVEALRLPYSLSRVHFVNVKSRPADLQRLAIWLEQGLEVPLAETIPVREIAGGLAQLQRAGGRIAVRVADGF